jgi:hypothetical protein
VKAEYVMDMASQTCKSHIWIQKFKLL